MGLKFYLHLSALLKRDQSSRGSRRAFALSTPDFPKDTIGMLRSWYEAHRHLIDGSEAAQIGSYLYWTTFVLVVVAALFGLFSGVALLHYNGSEPVNVVYYLAMVVAVPLLTMFLALLSMPRANRQRSTLVHISPAYWMERLWALLSGKREGVGEIKLNPLVANWIIIRRSQWIALSFSVGLLVALLGTVVTKDIAFAWSTTLTISPESFRAFLSMIALPWRGWLSDAVPSLELIAQSRYFHLGGHLTPSMVANAAMLGAWWKFLAMATLCYAIGLRIVMIVIAEWGYGRAMRRAILSLDGVQTLLRDLQKPLITTQTPVREREPEATELSNTSQQTRLKNRYDLLIGWALETPQLQVIAEHFGITAPRIKEAGGGRSLEEDRQLLAEITEGREILMIVKAWEPPMMEVIDFIEAVAAKASCLTLLPVGTPKQGYRAKANDRAVWVEKIASEELEGIWIAA